MPTQRCPRAPGEQLEARVELVAHSAQAERGYARGGQFDGQRQAVEPPADIDREYCVLVVQREAWVDRPHSRLEQGHGPELARGARLGLQWHGQRHQTKLLFVHDPQRFLTGRKQRDIGRVPQNGLDQRHDRVEQVLAVVEHEQQLSAAQCRRRVL